MSGLTIKNNKFARFKYNIEKDYEAGIVLTGLEVKAIKANKFEIRDAVVKEEKGELFLWNMLFSELPKSNHKKKLLLHKSEIDKISTLMKDRTKHGFVISVRYNEKRKIKFDIGFGRVKKYQEKRESAKRSTNKRVLEKQIKESAI